MIKKGDPDGRGIPVGVKFVELILKPAREGLEKNEHPTLPGAGECANTSLPCFRVYVWVLKNARKFSDTGARARMAPCLFVVNQDILL